MKTHDFKLVNADTDSIMISKACGGQFSEKERQDLLQELNSLFPEKIKFEDDGYYERVCILKAKNYITLQDGKIKKKGSSLKSSKTEKALSRFMDEIISTLLYSDKVNVDLLDVYNKYIIEVHRLTDIQDWTSKKTVTKSVLEPSRTNEQRVLDAIGTKTVQAGDKVYVYFTEDGNLKLAENWSGDHDVVKLMKRIYSTLTIFKNVINLEQFPKYHLKNKKIQEKLLHLLEFNVKMKEMLEE